MLGGGIGTEDGYLDNGDLRGGRNEKERDEYTVVPAYLKIGGQ
jgi:hypothetical protein